jgi:TctA family transporter
MFHATKDRTVRFVCVYSSPTRFASHRAETGLGIPRISRTTRHSIGESINAMASALNHALGTPGTGAGPVLSGGFMAPGTNPGDSVAGAGPRLAWILSAPVMVPSASLAFGVATSRTLHLTS